jgi:mono/diheme cytochrome c family protein
MRSRSARLTARAALVLAVFVPTCALADADDGEKLARRWCAGCHLVAPDQQRATTDAPPFATIARMPGFTREKLVFFLLDPHPKMPSMTLSRSEASDLADYIAKLGQARK